MPNVAVYIPAKGHSLGVPAKNLSDLGGKPLVAWSIDCALEIVPAPASIFVSTDDPAISRIARDHGCTVLVRPPHLAADTARVAECLAHDLAALTAHCDDDVIIAVLLPTTPFRNAEAVRRAILRFLSASQSNSLVSVRPFPAPVAQALTLDAQTGQLAAIDTLDSVNSHSRRQQHATTYYPDGSLYLVRAAIFRDQPQFFFAGATLGFASDRFSSIDIDNPDDLEFARLIAAAQPKRGQRA